MFSLPLILKGFETYRRVAGIVQRIPIDPYATQVLTFYHICFCSLNNLRVFVADVMPKYFNMYFLANILLNDHHLN